MNFQEKYEAYLKITEHRLQERAIEVFPDGSRVGEAARYSLLSGGKRIRAILVLAACDMLAGKCDMAADFAVAIEMMHCYSLIHDDMPCMDDDNFRRGKPSCHRAFDEATALLAGDTLQSAAFEVISRAPVSADARLGAVRELSLAAGDRGMAFGQELDIKFESKAATDSQLRRIHCYKTGALINAALQMGIWAAKGTLREHTEMEPFALRLGLAFQIIDDVLDATASTEELGKTAGSDIENGKTTFYTLYGADGALDYARNVSRQACSYLYDFYGEKSNFLISLAESLLMRRN